MLLLIANLFPHAIAMTLPWHNDAPTTIAKT